MSWRLLPTRNLLKYQSLSPRLVRIGPSSMAGADVLNNGTGGLTTSSKPAWSPPPLLKPIAQLCSDTNTCQEERAASPASGGTQAMGKVNCCLVSSHAKDETKTVACSASLSVALHGFCYSGFAALRMHQTLATFERVEY